MSIKTNELQQIIAPQSEDSILMASAAAGTGQLTMARAAEFFGTELVKQTNSVGAALSQKVPILQTVPTITLTKLDMVEGIIADGWIKLSKIGNLVCVNAYVLPTANWEYSTLFAVLPEGFRPIGTTTSFTMFCLGKGAMIGAIKTTGEWLVNGAFSSSDWTSCTIAYFTDSL